MDCYIERLNQAFSNWNGEKTPDAWQIALDEVEKELNTKIDATNTEVNITNTEVNILVNQGSKNALEVVDFRVGSSHDPGPVTNRGITYTLNSDGTVTANGTWSDTGTTASSCQIWANVARSGNYIFTCGDHSATVQVDPDSLYDCFMGPQTSPYNTVIRDFYSPIETVGNTAYLEAGVPYRLTIRVHAGVTLDNEIFKPMLRLVDIKDSTFVPYAPTNRELYELIKSYHS